MTSDYSDIPDSSTAAVISVENESCGNEIPPKDKAKKPRRILHFSDGVLEEYSTDDEEKQDEKREQLPLINPAALTWAPYLWYYFMFYGSKTINVCDFVGEYLANLFGITSPKYQYEIDEYLWAKKQEEEEKINEEEEDFWKNMTDLEQIELETVELQPQFKADEKLSSSSP